MPMAYQLLSAGSIEDSRHLTIIIIVGRTEVHESTVHQQQQHTYPPSATQIHEASHRYKVQDGIIMAAQSALDWSRRYLGQCGSTDGNRDHCASHWNNHTYRPAIGASCYSHGVNFWIGIDWDSQSWRYTCCEIAATVVPAVGNAFDFVGCGLERLCTTVWASFAFLCCSFHGNHAW